MLVVVLVTMLMVVLVRATLMFVMMMVFVCHILLFYFFTFSFPPAKVWQTFRNLVANNPNECITFAEDLESYMKRLYLFIIVLLLVACAEKEPIHPVTEVLNPMTPVKNQGNSQSCWIYAMLAAIETEHISRGDSVNLSVAWIESHLKEEPQAPESGRGMGATALTLLQKYGVVGYDAMRTADAPRPRKVFLLGAEYTPQEFARSVCAPGEYVALTANADSAYGQKILIDEPDNWLRQRFLNVPMDTLLSRTERAVSRGHGVCWESKGHAMAVVGLARDTTTQRQYFVMKNSWGEKHGDHGLDYMSYKYFRRHTLAVCMTREAFEEP